MSQGKKLPVLAMLALAALVGSVLTACRQATPAYTPPPATEVRPSLTPMPLTAAPTRAATTVPPTQPPAGTAAPTSVAPAGTSAAPTGSANPAPTVSAPAATTSPGQYPEPAATTGPTQPYPAR